MEVRQLGVLGYEIRDETRTRAVVSSTVTMAPPVECGTTEGAASVLAAPYRGRGCRAPEAAAAMGAVRKARTSAADWSATSSIGMWPVAG
jgi:hypothetical protein